MNGEGAVVGEVEQECVAGVGKGEGESACEGGGVADAEGERTLVGGAPAVVGFEPVEGGGPSGGPEHGDDTDDGDEGEGLGGGLAGEGGERGTAKVNATGSYRMTWRVRSNGVRSCGCGMYGSMES